MITRPDSLIFDMDGTLWDAQKIYVDSWNAGLQEEKIDRLVTPEEIGSMMGMESDKVLNRILPGYTKEEQYRVYATVNKHRAEQVKKVGGTLYEGVKNGLALLSTKYKLFIVSNCPAGMIELFINWADLQEHITDEMAYGFNNRPKHHNIGHLIEKYQLETPVYIGDTDGDRIESELAGIPFVYFSFGFGKAERYDLTFDNFESFTNYFMSL